MNASSLPASLSFSTTFFKYPDHPGIISEVNRQNTRPERTLELCRELLLRSEPPVPRGRVPQRIQPKPIDNIDDLRLPLLERLLLFFGRGVGANVDVVGAFCDLSAVDFVDDVIDVLELVGVGDDLVARYDVL